MKRALQFTLALIVLTAVVSPIWAQGGGLRYSITVTKFENRAGWHGYWDLGDAWGLVMTDLLNQSGKFIVLGETDMRYEAMAEQDLAASGRTAQGSKAPATGQLVQNPLVTNPPFDHRVDAVDAQCK